MEAELAKNIVFRSISSPLDLNLDVNLIHVLRWMIVHKVWDVTAIDVTVHLRKSDLWWVWIMHGGTLMTLDKQKLVVGFQY